MWARPVLLPRYHRRAKRRPQSFLEQKTLEKFACSHKLSGNLEERYQKLYIAFLVCSASAFESTACGIPWTLSFNVIMHSFLQWLIELVSWARPSPRWCNRDNNMSLPSGTSQSCRGIDHESPAALRQVQGVVGADRRGT